MARIVEGDPGPAICREAERVKPAAIVMGTRGRSLFQRFLFLYVHVDIFHYYCKQTSFLCD